MHKKIFFLFYKHKKLDKYILQEKLLVKMYLNFPMFNVISSSSR